MVEVLYGEEVRPRVSYDFFAHMRECRTCDREFVELLETREQLSSWRVADDPPSPVAEFGDWRSGITRAWWPVLQKIAAAVLLAAGVLFLVQQTGLVNRSNSDEQVRQMVQDLVAARQEETLKVIGEALLDIKEEMVLRNRVNMDSVYGDMYTLEQRYLQVLEENNRQLGRLLNR
jgi:hypothetical protein